MKLTRVTSYYYFGLVFLLFGLATIITMKYSVALLYDSTDKSLLKEKNELIQSGQYDKITSKLILSKDAYIEKINFKKNYKDKYELISLKNDFTNETIDYRQLTSYFTQNNQTYRIIVKMEVSDSVKRITNHFFYLRIILFILLAFGIHIINRYIIKKVWAPFYFLLHSLQKFKIDKDTKIETIPSTIREFSEINDIVSNLINQNSNDFQKQKQFIENSSHEMKTPLAVITHRLDMLIQSDKLGEKELNDIQVIYDSIRRLTNLNKSLTLLFKIDYHHFGEIENVSLQTCLNKHIDNFDFLLEEKQLSINKKYINDCVIKINAILVDVLITNLLSNAIKYAHPNSEILIKIIGTNFHIINYGNPLPVSEKKIFERFIRFGAEESSVGLGLSIIDKICSLYTIPIEYTNKGEIHAFFIDFSSISDRNN